MKCSLGFSNFLDDISSLSHSIVFLYFFEEGSTTERLNWTEFSGGVFRVFYVEDHVIYKQWEFYFFFSSLDSFYFFLFSDCCGNKWWWLFCWLTGCLFLLDQLITISYIQRKSFEWDRTHKFPWCFFFLMDSAWLLSAMNQLIVNSRAELHTG